MPYRKSPLGRDSEHEKQIPGAGGVPVDVYGGPTVDPTKNVLDLVNSANIRQDDLRQETNRRIDAELKCVRDIATLRTQHIDELLNIRTEYQEKLRDAEAKRIDAIRSVDVNAVAVASERQTAAAGVLATQLAQSTEALRTLVSTTASTVADQQRQSTQQITERLAALEKSSYEGAGRQAFVDPAVAALSNEVKQLTSFMAAGSGKAQGSNTMLMAVIAVGGLVVAIVVGVVAYIAGAK